MNTRATHQPPWALPRRLLPLLGIGGIAGGIVSGLVGQHITDVSQKQANVVNRLHEMARGLAFLRLGIVCFVVVVLLTLVFTVSATTRTPEAREDTARTPPSQQRLPVAGRRRLMQTQGVIVAALLFVVALGTVVAAVTGDYHLFAVLGGLTYLLLFVSPISIIVLIVAIGRGSGTPND